MKRTLVALALALMLIGSTALPAYAAYSDPVGKHDPIVSVTAARDIVLGKEQANYENNIWLQMYKDYLGVDLTYDWLVPTAQYDARVNMAVTSQELPDIMVVNMRQLYQLQEAGLIHDLTQVWEQSATPLVKEMYEAAGAETSLNIATIDGKLYGIPEVTPIEESCRVMFIREDWRKKLNLPEPKTIEDMMTLFEGFATMDPDGNGKDDTYALGITKDLFTLTYDMASFANSYHAYPNIWLEKDGQIVFGGVQPEMKDALAALADMYQKKWINPEFTVSDEAKAAEDLLNGKLGALFGVQFSMWTANAGVDLYKTDPEAEIKCYPIPGIDQGVKPVAYNNTNRFFVVTNKCSNPEVLVQMLDLIHWMAIEAGPDDMAYDVWNDDIWSQWEYALIRPETVHFNVQRWINAHTAYETGAEEDIKNVTERYLNRLLWEGAEPFWRNGAELRLSSNEEDRTFASTWFGYTTSGEVFRIIREQYADKLMVDKRGPIITESMVDYQSTLDALQLTMYTNIITGDEPIDAYDTFVEQWYAMGGDLITEEMNDFYQK